MSVESKAKELLSLRARLDQCEHDYENQRLDVHNALVNAGLEFIEVDGFKIAHVPESTVMLFRRDLLKQELLSRGLSEAVVVAIMSASKEETTRDGILRITKI